MARLNAAQRVFQSQLRAAERKLEKLAKNSSMWRNVKRQIDNLKRGLQKAGSSTSASRTARARSAVGRTAKTGSGRSLGAANSARAKTARLLRERMARAKKKKEEKRARYLRWQSRTVAKQRRESAAFKKIDELAESALRRMGLDDEFHESMPEETARAMYYKHGSAVTNKAIRDIADGPVRAAFGRRASRNLYSIAKDDSAPNEHLLQTTLLEFDAGVKDAGGKFAKLLRDRQRLGKQVAEDQKYSRRVWGEIEDLIEPGDPKSGPSGYGIGWDDHLR